MRSDAITKAPLAANISAAVNTSQIFPLNSNLLAPCAISVPASGTLEQYEFEIAASGRLTTNGAYTALITLFAALAVPAANPLTPASWTIIGATTARAVGTTSCPWFYRAHLVADAISKKLQGTFGGMVNNLVDAPAAVTNVLANVNLAAAVDPAIVFAIGITFGTADALNIGQLTYFGLEG